MMMIISRMMRIIIIINTFLHRRSVEALNFEIIREDVVLKGMRRNNFFSWRPVPSRGRFVRADTQEWTRNMPEGSHRIKATWAENRYRWLEDEARPILPLPGWKGMTLAKELEDMTEHEFCAAEEDRIVLNGLTEHPEGFPANEGPDLGEWTLQEEADWSRTEDEPSFEASAAYQERLAVEEAIRQQRSPLKARMLKEVRELMTAPEYEDPKGQDRMHVKNRQLRDMTKAGVDLHVGRFKERLKGSSVADAIAAIPLRATRAGDRKGGQGGKKKRGRKAC